MTNIKIDNNSLTKNLYSKRVLERVESRQRNIYFRIPKTEEQVLLCLIPPWPHQINLAKLFNLGIVN